jgi:hypothetical protein
MILQITACIFSILGYYYIAKNPKYSYVSFILLNCTLLISNFQISLILNSIFSLYFLIRYVRTIRSTTHISK